MHFYAVLYAVFILFKPNHICKF